MNDNDRSEWLAKRRECIGASEAAILAGLSRWGTPLQIYLDKKGLIPEQEMNMAQKLGLKMEPVIASLYEEATGRKLILCAEHQRHPEFHWIGANPDRQTADGMINVQLKKSAFRGPEWGEQGTDEIPMDYMIQVQQEMLVTGQGLTHLAVLFFQGQEFCWYEIKADKGIQDEIIALTGEFWEKHIVAGIPPPPDFGHVSTPDLIKRMYSKVGDVVLDAAPEQVPELLLVISALDEAKEREKKIKEEKECYKARLLAAMQEATLLTVGGYILTRKIVKRMAYSVEASSYVDFRVKRKKGE